MLVLPPALAALNAYRQFIVYTLQPSRTRPGKTDKFPVHPVTGAWPVNAHDPTIWHDAPSAIAAAAARGSSHGIGFVFTEGDPLWFIDIDSCLQTDNTWSPIAQQLLQVFAGAAVEVSSSGRGLHIIGSGTAPEHGCKNAAHSLEFYTSGRFVALTGIHAQGDAGTDHSRVLPWLVSSYFPNVAPAVDIDWTDAPCADWRGPEDDATLIARALRSQSARAAFGHGASFAALWEADVTALARAFPDPLRPYDESSADAALAQHLMFWTGRHASRVLSLMKQSALVRPKWERDDYLRRTIGKALAQSVDVLQDKPPEPMPAEPSEDDPSPRPQAATGNTFLSIAEQAGLFAGCVYVADGHQVLVPGGRMIKPEQFRTRFGGYSFPMDPANERVTRNAWEAFTESQALRAPRADSYTFRPDKPPGAVLVEDGQRMANTYWPVVTPRAKGDVSRFMRHLAMILPDERDRTLILSYMAACVQFKGYKFQWAPLLQGIEGNGKSLLSECVAFAVGARYSHFPKAAQIASQFNGWMYGKIFIGVEDVYVPEGREDVIEALKPMITRPTIEIEPKGQEKVTRSICCNFILNMNRKEGFRKTRNDRRFAPLYTAQQTMGDLERCGMRGEFFPDYYNWLRARGKYAGTVPGYAIISELLHTYAIPAEFGLDVLLSRAPETTSTNDAVLSGLGRVEQEINEAIEQGLPGFAGGWISSIMLERLLDRIRASARIPPNRRREILQSLGYDWHPHLLEGRVHNTIMYPDGGKPRLFVKTDGPHVLISGGAEIARAYAAAQDSPLLTPATIGGNVVSMPAKR